MCGTLGLATFTTPYRRGNQLSLFFEKKTDNSVLLFNHRNKVPKSETRTVTFGGPTIENDGIELTYNEPNAPNASGMDSPSTIYFPTDMSAKAAKKVQANGIRNLVQATILGWRLYNKLRYQNITVQFDALYEAALVIPGERVLVADNTRPQTQDGEIESQTGLTLVPSQPVAGLPDADSSHIWNIFLQHFDGSVETLRIDAASSAEKSIVLQSAPTLPCVTDATSHVQTLYSIYMTVLPALSGLTATLGVSKVHKNAFLLTS